MNCYQKVSESFNIEFDNAEGLEKFLKEHFNEVNDGTLQKGDIVVRPGHVGTATGDGDNVSQFGYPEDILPTANQLDALEDKKKASGLSKSEEKLRKKLKKKLDKWFKNNDFSENTASLKNLKANRNDDYKVYRLKGCHSGVYKPPPPPPPGTPIPSGGGQCR